MIEKLLGAFLGAPAQQIAEYFKEKQRLKQELKLAKIRAQTAAERAREERAKQADSNDQEWARLQIEQSGWKDEYWTIVVSIPMIFCFIPITAPYILTGFNILEKTPDWYKMVLLVVIGAPFGVKIWKKFFK